MNQYVCQSFVLLLVLFPGSLEILKHLSDHQILQKDSVL